MIRMKRELSGEALLQPGGGDPMKTRIGLGGSPVGALDDGWRLVGLSACETLFFAAAGVEQNRAQSHRSHAGNDPEFFVDGTAQIPDLVANFAIDLPELPLHSPQGSTIGGAE